MDERIKSWVLIAVGLTVMAVGFLQGSTVVIGIALFVGCFLIALGVLGHRMEGRQVVGPKGVELNLVSQVGEEALEQKPDLEPQQLLAVLTSTLPKLESRATGEVIRREVAYTMDAVLADHVGIADSIEVELRRGEED